MGQFRVTIRCEMGQFRVGQKGVKCDKMVGKCLIYTYKMSAKTDGQCPAGTKIGMTKPDTMNSKLVYYL